MFRVSDPSTNVGYYGYCYRQNDSTYSTNEKLNLTLSGLRFIGQPDDDFIEIPSGGNNIIVMRNEEAFGSTSYGMSMSMKGRGLSDAEIVNKCIEKDAQQLTGDITYKMMLSDQGGCMVFDNSDSNKGKMISVDIEGSSNLRIDGGETFLKKDVKVEPNN